MDKQKYAAPDAKEMATILKQADCMKRYDRISHDILSEILVAAALDGEVEGKNRRGSDVRSSLHGRIEVKSRILGTDGPFPRVSLKTSNIEKADFFVAVRWEKDFSFHDAVMLPKDAACRLYSERRQSSGTAHISWKDWQIAPGAVSLKTKIGGILGDL